MPPSRALRISSNTKEVYDIKALSEIYASSRQIASKFLKYDLLEHTTDASEGRDTMPDKNQPEEVAARETTSTGEHFFDELTKGLAEGTISRGRALKLIGASLLGGVGALSLFGGTAEARRRRHHHHRRRRGGGGGCGRGCFRGQTANGNNVCVSDFICNPSNTSGCDNNNDCFGSDVCIVDSGCRFAGSRGVCASPC